ncbi:hypothetical protein [Kitasatospora sp. MAP5-34]|uniref:hypothetical protein n=1 Tax=Kitasatospora sp. MAP5-34 TaxID=3035102 RepID=UPI00247538FC|nr:hypothetical protein [Kitasatospora sp. MAP5-34]MDH6577075.1 hypothetical protein [Kitasatospora sp. MAP5-34]
MTERSTDRGRAQYGRGLGRARAAAALLVLLLAGAAGCASDGGNVTQDLGRVPIPTPPASPIVPTAVPGHPQLVAMGDAVHLDLGPQQAQITATGPDLALSAPAPGGTPPSASRGTVTVTLHVPAGSGALSASGLAVSDELGHPVPFTTDLAAATATPGHDAVLHLAATFAAGHSTLSWAAAGKPLATWDFEVELD